MSTPPRIVIWLTDPVVDGWNFSARQARSLAHALPGGSVQRCTTLPAFLRALPRADIVLVWRFETAWLARAPRLQWIATPSAGRDYFQVEPRAGLRITYGEFHGPIMAETVLGMMLGVTRGLFDRLHPPVNRDPWPRAALTPRMSRLNGARVTILGFGRIGQAIGRQARHFGAVITGIRQTRQPLPPGFAPPDQCLPRTRLDAVLPKTDHLVMVLPAVPETDRILDARRLARLPRHAALYNVGRGNAIDEAALAQALHAGQLRAAALDVFSREPLHRGSPLWQCPNVLTLPHISAVAPDYLDLFTAEFVQRFRQWITKNDRHAGSSQTASVDAPAGEGLGD